jgi:hypothetical protein
MVSIEPIGCIQAWKSLPYWLSERSQFMRLQPRGHWLGAGCKLLNLHNPVRWDPLLGLLQGSIPSGENVVPRDQDTLKRIAAWRFTFATPIRDLIRWGVDPTQIGPIGVAHGKAVTAALNSFDQAIAASVDTPPWEYPPTSVFALFRGLPGRPHGLHTGTTVFFINLGFAPDKTAQVYPAETVLKESQCLVPAYLEHLAILRPQRDQATTPLRICAPAPAQARQDPGQTPPQTRPAQDQAPTVQPSHLNIVHHYGHYGHCH